MRFTRYFAALITFFVVTSCVNNDIDILAPSASADSGAVTICGRITSFDDHAVTTRAGKTNEESYSSSMAMAIFPIDENGTADDPTDDVLGDCISYIHLQGSNVNFTIDRKKLREEYGDIHDNKPFALYLFASMPELPANMAGLADTLVTLNDFMELAYDNSGIRRPQKGFPMVGSLGDYITAGADGKKFVLIPTTGEEPNVKISLPLVDNDPSDTNDGEPSDYIPIPLKALYAKFSFVITLEPDQHIQNGATPTFTLENYVLNNVPKSVCAGASSNSSTEVLSGKITTPVGTSVTEGGELKFDFYLPERFLTPNTLPKNFQYPLGENNTTVTGYSNVRDEDKKYCQRFKPDLVTGQNATYITLNGHYSDHQGHNWTVTYDIYLGEDNYGNFDFKRNTNYINSVVIRGIKAYKDNGEEGPYIDYRVTVTGALDIIISLQRETMLDSHFEVRPLRVRHPGQSGAPAGSTVTVEVLDELGNSFYTSDSYPNWVRIEHRNAGTVEDDYLPSGKRRFFTPDLVTNTLNNADGRLKKVTLTGNKQETFWIYVDQCDEGAPLSNPNQVRKAKIKVTYDKDGDPNTANEELVYTICQHLLYPVKTIRSAADVAGTSVPTDDEYIYYIEYEEEYLHNFDSEDSYGVTEEAGIEWGLDGIQLSHKDEAINVIATSSGLDFIAEYFGWDKQKLVNNAIKSLNPKPYYDFYMVRDVLPTTPITPYAYNGLQFNEEIAHFLKNDKTYKDHQGATSDKAAKIDGISLDEEPKSAFAYCYNRNKRNSRGEVVSQDWYLPAIDEIEDIMEFAYGDFDDEFQGNMYWSCQPAYYKYESSWQIESLLGGTTTVPGVYYTDNTNRARASKALRIDDAFAGVPDSGDGRYATQSGSIYAPLWGDPTITMDSPVLDLSHDSDYKNYSGNLPRTGTKARVRCIRKTEGVTVH